MFAPSASLAAPPPFSSFPSFEEDFWADESITGRFAGAACASTHSEDSGAYPLSRDLKMDRRYMKRIFELEMGDLKSEFEKRGGFDDSEWIGEFTKHYFISTHHTMGKDARERMETLSAEVRRWAQGELEGAAGLPLPAPTPRFLRHYRRHSCGYTNRHAYQQQTVAILSALIRPGRRSLANCAEQR